MSAERTTASEPCPFCGQTAGVIWVRAHEQCAACGQVIVPCCNGETAAACAPPTPRLPIHEERTGPAINPPATPLESRRASR